MATMIDEQTFAVLVAQSGLPLSADQKKELYEMYGYLVPMIERVCRERPREVEPALIFRPGNAS